jgi:2-dehydro-3-deoxy-L-rhamnonate dehydrogenase (NAD+)
MQSEPAVALVTGGASGIGRACAELLASRGAAVVVADVDENRAHVVAAELTASGGVASAVRVDVTSLDDCRAAVEHAVDEFGGLDALICSAGVGQLPIPAWEQPEPDWLRVVDINLNGVWRSCTAAISALRQSNRGRIVVLSSVAGKEGNANLAAYSASKAGVIGLTKSLAKELASEGILVNAVTPALIDTPMVRGTEPTAMKALLEKIPMGRLGTAAEVAELVAWLTSTQCSFSTGGVFDISGGRSTY